MDITKLKGHIPDAVYAQIQDTVTKFQINTVARLSNFLGQCDHESGGFTRTVENLNYSASGLLATFPKYFATLEIAKTYERNQQKIANHVYANRMGNGNEASGDGWKHKGMGYIQLTGKNNHDAFFKSIGLPVTTDPGLIATQYPLLSAGYFWNAGNINKIADGGVTTPVMTSVTKVVNGGTNGLQERINATLKYYNLLK
jgi:putative chitinase